MQKYTSCLDVFFYNSQWIVTLGLQVIACTAKCFDLRNILFSGYFPGSAEPGGADMWDGPGDEKGDAGGWSALLLCSREARSTRGEHSASVESGTTVDVYWVNEILFLDYFTADRHFDKLKLTRRHLHINPPDFAG